MSYKYSGMIMQRGYWVRYSVGSAAQMDKETQLYMWTGVCVSTYQGINMRFWLYSCQFWKLQLVVYFVGHNWVCACVCVHMVAAWLYVNTNFIELKQRGRTPSGPKFILYNHKDKTSTGERHQMHRSDNNNMIFLASLHHHRLHILTSAFIILVFSPSQLLCLTTRMFGVWPTRRPVAACVSLFAPWEVFQGRLPESRPEDISCHVS